MKGERETMSDRLQRQRKRSARQGRWRRGLSPASWVRFSRSRSRSPSLLTHSLLRTQQLDSRRLISRCLSLARVILLLLLLLLAPDSLPPPPQSSPVLAVVSGQRDICRSCCPPGALSTAASGLRWLPSLQSRCLATNCPPSKVRPRAFLVVTVPLCAPRALATFKPPALL